MSAHPRMIDHPRMIFIDLATRSELTRDTTLTPRIGIIGCGLVGATHAECLADLGVAPVGYFDERVKSASALSSRLGGSVAESAEALVAVPNINAVYICTYHDTHARYAVQAAAAGKHLFIEKPMAMLV